MTGTDQAPLCACGVTAAETEPPLEESDETDRMDWSPAAEAERGVRCRERPETALRFSDELADVAPVVLPPAPLSSSRLFSSTGDRE